MSYNSNMAVSFSGGVVFFKGISLKINWTYALLIHSGH